MSRSSIFNKHSFTLYLRIVVCSVHCYPDFECGQILRNCTREKEVAAGYAYNSTSIASCPSLLRSYVMKVLSNIDLLVSILALSD